MNKLLMVFLLLISFNTAHAQSSYKCYAVDYEGNKYLLVHYADNEKHAMQYARTQRAYNKELDKDVLIDYIYECVNVSDTFKNRSARKLDARIEM